MSKRSTVQPKWLDSMLVRWGIASLQRESNTLGFYKINPMLKSGIPTTAPVYEPFELTPADFEQLQRAINGLETKYHLIIIRAYKPWQAPAVEIELERFNVTQRTWERWLHDAAARIEAAMCKTAQEA